MSLVCYLFNAKVDHKGEPEGENCVKVHTMTISFFKFLFLHRTRDPDAKSFLHLVHTDLTGHVPTESVEGCKYKQSFTDDYSGSMFVHFLKKKSNTVLPRKSSLQIYLLMGQ